MEDHYLCGDFNLSVKHKKCPACIAVMVKAMKDNPLTRPLAMKRAKFSASCHVARIFWQGRAHSIIREAKKSGVIPALDGSVKCADCDLPAYAYDHRDYGRPLDVDPVCRSCNRKRGPATYPKPPLYVDGSRENPSYITYRKIMALKGRKK